MPLILINPSLRPFETLKKFTCELKRFHTGEKFLWKPAYVRQLYELYKSVNFEEIDRKKLYFFLSKDDELLDHSQIPHIFAGSNIFFYDNSGHSFEKFEEIIPKIEKLWKHTNAEL